MGNPRRREGEEIARSRPAREVLREGAAQAGEDRIAGRRPRAKSVGGAALDDEDEAAVGRGLRHRDVRRGEEEGRGGGGLAEEGTAIHDHLLRNSGATSSSASP